MYPAAALEMWGLSCRGYKGSSGAEIRRALVEELLKRLTSVVIVADDHRNALIVSDHCLDALVAALVVRCHELGMTDGVPTEQVGAAAVKGRSCYRRRQASANWAQT